MKFQLHQLAYKIFSHSFQHNIDLHVQWIPRDLNVQADFVSKIKDCDDLQLTSDIFLLWNASGVLILLHCFASYYNAKTSHFSLEFRILAMAGLELIPFSNHGKGRIVY